MPPPVGISTRALSPAIKWSMTSFCRPKKESNPKILNVSARGTTSYYNFAKKIHKALGPNYKNCKLIPIFTKDLKKLVKNYTKMKRPLNSKLNIDALEKFLKRSIECFLICKGSRIV